jgi:cation transport ATPase
VEDRRVAVGSLAQVTELGLDLAGLEGEAEGAAVAGRTPLAVSVDDQVAGLLVQPTS